MVDAELVERFETLLGEGAIAHFVIWRVPRAVRGSSHEFKYRLAFVVDGICVLRYDNEAGKGDHRHVGEQEDHYHFVDVSTLRRDFIMDAQRWLRANPRG